MRDKRREVWRVRSLFMVDLKVVVLCDFAALRELVCDSRKVAKAQRFAKIVAPVGSYFVRW